MLKVKTGCGRKKYVTFAMKCSHNIQSGFGEARSILSAGQKKRLGLARLLIADRPLWLLDEPTVSLDTASIKVLGVLMAAHLARGGLILAATHVDLGIEGARQLEFGGRGA